MKEMQELTHARLDPAVSRCPGLFAARDRRGLALRIDQQIGEVELMWRAVESGRGGKVADRRGKR